MGQKTRVINRTRNKRNKRWNKKKVKYARPWNKQYIRKFVCIFNNFNNKMWIFWKNSFNFECVEKERELRVLAKKKE